MGFGNFPTTLGVWGFLENCETSPKRLQSLKTSVDGNISDAAGLPQSRLCILEWSNRNFGSRLKNGIYGHHTRPTNCVHLPLFFLIFSMLAMIALEYMSKHKWLSHLFPSNSIIMIAPQSLHACLLNVVASFRISGPYIEMSHVRQNKLSCKSIRKALLAGLMK